MGDHIYEHQSHWLTLTSPYNQNTTSTKLCHSSAQQQLRAPNSLSYPNTT